MKKLLLGLFTLILTTISLQLKGQNLLYRDTFVQSAVVCHTDYSWKKYTAFRAACDTSTKIFTEVRMWGEVAKNASVSERVCKDKDVVRKLAAALKNGTAYLGSCNGYYWDVSSAGTCASTGCTGSSTNDIVHMACYPTSNGVLSTCYCGATDYWVIRTTIRNVNKGGVMVGTSGTTCNPGTQWVELEFKANPPFNYDIATAGITPLNICTVQQNIQARFLNLGKLSIDSFQYGYTVNTTNYGPFWAKAKLAPQKDTSINVAVNYTFTPSTMYNILVWSNKPNNQKDSFAGDDTVKMSMAFNGSKGTPNAIDTLVCGSQSTQLRAIPNSAGDSLAWFGDRGMTNLLGFGTKYTTKYLPSGAKYKFYVASYNGFNKSSINLGYSYVNYWPGNMFDVKALSNDLFMDSMGLNIYAIVNPAGTDIDVEVYVREGSYTDAGATTTSSMWTNIYKGKVRSMGSQVRSPFPIQYTFSKGKQYAMYVHIPTSGLLFDPGTRTVSNGELEIKTGTANGGLFSNPLTNYDFDGEIFYRYLLCKSAPDSATLDIKPTPFGARLEAGAPFQTSPKKSGVGSKNAPHVVALGDTLGFNLKSPTNFPDATHNSNWKVASVTLVTAGGRSLSSGFGWTDPVSGSSPEPGKLVYTPATTEIDTVVMVKVRIQEIGGSGCDTFLTHYIYVAPLPAPDFSRAGKICDGDPVEFTNKSTIESGFLEYKWHFGTGDSSEASDPIYQYPSFGTFYCRLDAISSIYGYVRSKIDTITVTQIPNVAFTIQNACETKTHQFINKSTVSGGTLSYEWNFGDPKSPSPSFLKDPTHKYTDAGQYKVTLKATANGCQSSLTKNAYLFPKPTANFTYPSAGIKYCTNTPVTFTSTSTITSGNMGVLWSFELGEFGTIPKPTHVFDQAGTYTIKLTAISEFGCIDSAKKTLTIFGAPKVAFSHGQVCDQTPTIFTNNTINPGGTFANNKWSFGDGQSSTASSPTHQYTVLGPKVVKLVVNLDNGCSDSAMDNITVGTQALVDFGVQNTCSGKEVQFENKTTFKQGSIKYKWYFGGVDSTEITDPKYTFNVVSSTTYNITLRATVDGGCVSSKTIPMTVYELPDCSFTVADDWTQAADGYRTVKVTANDLTYPFYRYKFSDGGSLNTATGTYQFPYEGDFSITLVTRNTVDCECSSTQMKSIKNSTGVDNLSGQGVSIYPNPSTGVVYVQTGSEIQSIEVFNVLGESVTVSNSISGSKGVLEFGDASNGVYLIKVTTEAGTTTRRVTINR